MSFANFGFRLPDISITEARIYLFPALYLSKIEMTSFLVLSVRIKNTSEYVDWILAIFRILDSRTSNCPSLNERLSYASRKIIISYSYSGF